MNAKCAYRRRSLRLKHYDYSKAGFYFITICTQDRLHLFGEIVDGIMVLNDAGRMIHTLWYDIANDFENVKLHQFIIMPNHIHGIIEIQKQSKSVGADSISALNQNSTHNPKIVKKSQMQHESKRAEMDSAPTTSNIYYIYDKISTINIGANL